ncbi:bifunctional serine/threonine-protein kinase/ABC transporter substrate-binding protein [Streptomyces sp. WMMC500]|uniref:bifunctional serine/threonine-protein kinase/ABC transporter substrate-binding protein n=1 Tax=Streptomyces sp. WMMC500 TaxID=3015154 RepID=UPI00248CE85E|nr:bifunctional serine/threonine-protein kinase/ABC transporter substrate-binding protein [Streptomyces sp. WMMC500]WBB63109.1 bifunctional serine/threonine-protein kinase/ABC transporter substrate-binding protein [Streptomyces sp. WMMC500]
MRALTPDDPGTLGGHRLLARLGAGGMGVVYLARTPGGALVALKVIRAEHAADPGFRARFRREVTAAGRLRGRWLVPVVAADAEAREPWLATEFVPGPTLTETVDGYGPWPERAVLRLGAYLAGTLADVHRAGLVHRDVKPGNVLLTLDGPRLIDFGIARVAGATALTESDVVIGSPGYLAPEQARTGTGDVGPPADVFALGCVLAYAASARRPFGTGNPAAVLFRTVHEPPDLSGVPEGALRGWVERCLRKTPEERPAAAELAAGLSAVLSAARPVDEPEPGPEAARADTPPDATVVDAASWLPPAVVRIVAERSARALDIPAPIGDAPATSSEEPAPGPAGRPPARPTRRRFLAAGTAAAGIAGAGLLAYGLSRGGTSGAGTPPVHTLGLHADLSGPGKDTGRAHERAARLAVDRHNARDDAGFRLALEVADDGGDREGAARVARRFADDAAVRAVIGPTTDAAARAAAGVYRAARLGAVLVNLDGTGVPEADAETLAVTRAAEELLPAAFLVYLSNVGSVTRTAVVRDESDAAWEFAQAVNDNPPGGGSVTVHGTEDGIAAAVGSALSQDPQAVLYAGGSPANAARCARALKAADFTGPRGGTWQTLGPAFLSAAGAAAAEGWLCATPFTDPAAAGDFAAAYRDAYGTAPSRWAPEAYDAVGLVAAAVARLKRTAVDDTVERGALAQELFRDAYRGVVKDLRFAQDRTHQPELSGSLFLYEVRDGAFAFLGPYDEVRQAG